FGARECSPRPRIVNARLTPRWPARTPATRRPGGRPAGYRCSPRGGCTRPPAGCATFVSPRCADMNVARTANSACHCRRSRQDAGRSEIPRWKTREPQLVLAPAPLRELAPPAPTFDLRVRRVLVDAEGGRDQLRSRHADERRGLLGRVVAEGRDPPRGKSLHVQVVEELVEVERDEVLPLPRPVV